MTENEFLLQDRIAKIRSVNEQHDLLNNSYISFSGGKDSTVLSHLMDEALPGNKIPRLFLNTGIEYGLVLKFVREVAEKDDRIHIYILLVKISEKLWMKLVILSNLKNMLKEFMILSIVRKFGTNF